MKCHTRLKSFIGFMHLEQNMDSLWTKRLAGPSTLYHTKLLSSLEPYSAPPSPVKPQDPSRLHPT